MFKKLFEKQYRIKQIRYGNGDTVWWPQWRFNWFFWLTFEGYSSSSLAGAISYLDVCVAYDKIEKSIIKYPTGMDMT